MGRIFGSRFLVKKRQFWVREKREIKGIWLGKSKNRILKVLECCELKKKSLGNKKC
jgi:hypothetical protein